MTAGPSRFSPATVDELAKYVQESARESRSLAIEAGGTKAAFGNIAPSPESRIDMSGLSSIIDYSPVDLMIALEPGVTLSAVDEVLGAEVQRLAFDAPLRERATIGGSFAAGLSGPRRLRFGSLKDFVVGAEIINSSGAVTRTGGMVVKNVSGYEMTRLHYGAHGAFGIVTRLNLKVLPLPEHHVEVRARYPSAAECLRGGAAMLESRLDPAAVYALNGPDGGWALHVQIEGSGTFTASQSGKVQNLLNDGGSVLDQETVEVSGRSTPDYDDMLNLLDTGSRLVARLSVPASRQAAILEQLTTMPGGSILADPGSGLVYLRCEASEQTLQSILDVMPGATFLALPDELKSGRDVFGAMHPNAGIVLRRMKQEFDPASMFNPGRFVLNL